MLAITDLQNLAPARMQRAYGQASVSFHAREGRTHLDRLFQEGCAKLRFPRPLGTDAPQAILINTAGGLTGGDRFGTEVKLAEKAQTCITTQACERVYRSTGADAVVTNRLRLSPGARLAWLPQETILFDGGRLSRTLDVDLAGDSELVAVEAVLFGRQAMGETLQSGHLHDRWRIRRDGRLIFADDLRAEDQIAARLAPQPAMAGCRAMATVLFAGPAPERFLDQARSIIGPGGGASAWNGKFLARLVEETGLALRRRLEPLLTLLLGGRPLPKVWQL
ncbi:MAG: urease accessory protein UreD [Bosea sp.]|uniref:urease accessory protein UreD n=2 Tax=Bosea TaxID=85413 RepID=UPI00095B7EEA|nr:MULTISPECIES: urease accessory protein UreD [unclassified Bosea (in: a-proteobacteria)]MBN9458285.1 urease accessory protein UreD [Bosea sp. (in: a-proteobacteria)]OJV06984.1 MAG: urease accessory protein [Bosea sp. 67-29]